MNYHSTSIIHKNAFIGKNVEIGPFSIIEEYVEIGDNTKIGPNVLIRNYTSIGKDCKIFNGSVIGEVPMDLKFAGEKSKLIIVKDAGHSCFDTNNAIQLIKAQKYFSNKFKHLIM